jgi:hypothetical protein
MAIEPHAPDVAAGAAPEEAAPAQASPEEPLEDRPQAPEHPGYIPYRHLRQAAEPADERGDVRARRAYADTPAPWYLRKSAWMVGAIVAVLALAGIAVAASGGRGGGDNEVAQPETATATSGADADAEATERLDTGQEVHALGEAAHTPSFDVTVVQVVDPYTPTSAFDTEDHLGFRLVAVEADVTNTSDRELQLSTVGGTGLTDAQDRTWDIAIAGVDRPRLDGFIAPDETRRGWIVFEVADDATDLQLRLKGNLSATGSLFDLD